MTFLTWEQAVQRLREMPDQQELVRACYFDDPIVVAAERYHKSIEWSAVVDYLPAIDSGKALDLGAGRGISSYALAKEGWRVTAVEPDQSALVGADAIRALSQESGLSIEVVCEFSEELPFAEGSFDLVYCRQVLHHAREITQTCNEVFRVLKPGGRMIATREHVISKKHHLQTFLDKHPLHKLYGGENAFLLSDYVDAIVDAGFYLRDVLAPFDTPINYYPLTEEQWVSRCTVPLTNWFGEKFTHWLFGRETGIGSLLTPLLAKAVNWYDDSPGRLYSFIADKPKNFD